MNYMIILFLATWIYRYVPDLCLKSVSKKFGCLLNTLVTSDHLQEVKKRLFVFLTFERRLTVRFSFEKNVFSSQA